MDNEKLSVIEKIKKHEGGYNPNEPRSVGGESYAGVTPLSYKEFLARHPDQPSLSSMQQLEGNHDLINAFYDDYLDEKHVWELPPCLQYIYADASVNMGNTAIKIIQRVVGLSDDGVWGSGTTKAIAEWKAEFLERKASDPHADDALIMRFHDEKIAHYEWLVSENPAKFGKWLNGWKKRSMLILTELDEYFRDEGVNSKIVEDDDDAEVVVVAEIDSIDLTALTDNELLTWQKRFNNEFERRLGALRT